jgi:hypothetical protein
MPAATFTTTLGEMNRLYGIYVEATNGEHSQRAWTDYERYAPRYSSERGLKTQLGEIKDEYPKRL